MSLFRDLTLSRRPLAAFVAIGFAWGTLAGLVPAIKAQIAASDALYGFVMLFASVGAVSAMWLAPFVFRKAGRFALVVGCAGLAAGFVTGGLAGSAIWFATAMFVAAAGTGVADVLANAELSDTEVRSGQSLMNLNHGMYSFAFAGAAMSAGTLRGAGWGPADVMTLMAACVGALTLVMLAPDKAARITLDKEAPEVPHAFPLRLVILGGLVLIAAFLSEAATEGWSALHLERTLGAQPEGGALGPALFGLTMGIGRVSGHVLSSRVSDLWLMSAAALMSAVGLGIAGLAPTLVVAYVGFAAAGLGISVVVPLAIALIGRSVQDEVRLMAITRATAMGYAAFFVGPPVMGAVAEVFGLRASFVLIAALLVAVAVFLIPALGRQVRAMATPR